MVNTLEWTDAGVRFIDQTKLPTEEVFVTCRTYQEVAEAIRTMVVRGAPAIGVAAAMGIALGARNLQTSDMAEFRNGFGQICRSIGNTRPTAVNLFWAIRRMQRCFEGLIGNPVPEVKLGLIAEAQRMHEEDIAANQAKGRFGASSARHRRRAHALQRGRAGYGRLWNGSRRDPRRGRVRQTATRLRRRNPSLPARRPADGLGANERGIPTTLICDNMAGVMMAQGKVQAVVVGADRIAANGDTANKIGTYTVAILAHEHHIPFYVAAPFSTVDMETPDGSRIPIEQRARARLLTSPDARWLPIPC